MMVNLLKKFNFFYFYNIYKMSNFFFLNFFFFKKNIYFYSIFFKKILLFFYNQKNVKISSLDLVNFELNFFFFNFLNSMLMYITLESLFLCC